VNCASFLQHNTTTTTTTTIAAATTAAMASSRRGRVSSRGSATPCSGSGPLSAYAAYVAEYATWLGAAVAAGHVGCGRGRSQPAPCSTPSAAASNNDDDDNNDDDNNDDDNNNNNDDTAASSYPVLALPPVAAILSTAFVGLAAIPYLCYPVLCPG
jgi:hypothetical protein